MFKTNSIDRLRIWSLWFVFCVQATCLAASEHPVSSSCIDRLFAETASPVAAASALLAGQQMEVLENRLRQLVAIESVSEAGGDREALNAAAELVAKFAANSGLQNSRTVPISGQAPLVLAEWMGAPGKPTVLFYGHYDVVGAKAADWKTPPFTLTTSEGRWYGRGTADNKAGVLAFLAAVASCLETSGTLPVNIRLLIEGGEEADGDLTPFMKANPDLVAADYAIAIDSENHAPGHPGLATALRGSFRYDIAARVGIQINHAGLKMGAVPSPVLELARMIGALTDAEGNVTVGTWLSPTAHSFAQVLEEPDADFRKEAGVFSGTSLLGGGNASFRTARMTAMHCTGIVCDDVGPEQTTRLPAVARARLAFRTVPGTGIEELGREIKERMESVNWNGLTLEVNAIPQYTEPWRIDPESFPAQAALRSLAEGFGQNAFFREMGGSLPVASLLQDHSGARALLLYAVADPLSALHGPNESVDIASVQSAAKTTIRLLHLLGTP